MLEVQDVIDSARDPLTYGLVRSSIALWSKHEEKRHGVCSLEFAWIVESVPAWPV